MNPVLVTAELGHVVIIRNIGGRITPTVIDEIALLVTPTQAWVATSEPDGN